jgi:hypothetical protein
MRVPWYGQCCGIALSIHSFPHIFKRGQFNPKKNYFKRCGQLWKTHIRPLNKAFCALDLVEKYVAILFAMEIFLNLA